MRFDFTTRASPEEVLRALTDFTESRLETWNRTHLASIPLTAFLRTGWVPASEGDIRSEKANFTY
jgi:hypothetical protein